MPTTTKPLSSLELMRLPLETHYEIAFQELYRLKDEEPDASQQHYTALISANTGIARGIAAAVVAAAASHQARHTHK